MRKALVYVPLVLALLGLGAMLLWRIESLPDPHGSLRWTAILGILAIGAAFPIATGGIDLSVGSQVGLIGCLLPVLMIEQGLGTGSTLLLTLGVCLAVGLGHGWLVARMKIQPFIVTLFGLILYRGLARLLAGEQAVSLGALSGGGLRRLLSGAPVGMALTVAILGAMIVLLAVLSGGARIGRGSSTDGRGPARCQLVAGLAIGMAGILVWQQNPRGWGRVMAPTPLLAMLATGIFAWALTSKTVFGRHLRAVGHNHKAAHFSGVNTGATVMTAYLIGALCTGLGALLLTVQADTLHPRTHGASLELYAVAAALLGGCSLRGGRIWIPGVVAGAMALGMVHEMIGLLRVPETLQLPLVASLVLLGVGTDLIARRWVERRRTLNLGFRAEA
jgi:ribose transport system permease protein